MTTSSEQTRTESLHGDHWIALTARLSRESTSEFSSWLAEDLKELEAKLAHFVTPRSLGKSLSRERK